MSDPLGLVAAVAVVVAVGLVVWEVMAAAAERQRVRDALRTLDDYAVTDLRERELMVPIAQRVLRPLAQSLVGLGRRFMPAGYLEGVRTKLQIAGRGTPEEMDRFRIMRVLTVAAVPVLALIMLVIQPLPPRDGVIVFALLGAVLVFGPDAVLNRQMEERRGAIRHRLADIIDLLTISVEAGLGFDQALERTVAAVPGPLSEEFARMLGEIRAGAGRADALRNLDARTNVPEVRSFVLALIQAEQFGVPVGRILRAQAEEIRVKRRQLAQEDAQKAPVKLLFPMVFCIFPGIFVVLLGPAALNYMNASF